MGTPKNRGLYGVRYDDMYLKKQPPSKPGTTLQHHFSRREPAALATDLGPTCLRYAPFAADPIDQPTVLHGALYRFAREIPPIDKCLLLEFRCFVREQVRLLFDKIQKPVSFEEYLQGTHYNLAKKEKLLRLREEQLGCPRTVQYSSFGKAEFISLPSIYQETPGETGPLLDIETLIDIFYKDVRCINGPDDKWKAYAAHLIHAVEKQVCLHPAFAKYIPVMKRPEAIVNLLSLYPPPYFVTDYTSFEASFGSEFLDACEGELYRYMLEDFEEMPHIVKFMTGKHRCRFREFVLTVLGTRMSGDPNTSLGNGFSNLMLMLFMCHKRNITCEGFVEGDDGLFAFSGEPDFSIITRLGFDLKFEPHSTPFTSSFCGLLLSQSLACFTEPVFEIIKFGWTMSSLRHSQKLSVRRGLLRAKALSLFYCHPRCPMITALALRYIALTKNEFALFSSNYWEKTIVDETIKYEHEARLEYERGISIQDRLDFSKLFSISLPVQYAFEEYISTAGFEPLDHWSIDLITANKPHYAWMAETHVM